MHIDARNLENNTVIEGDICIVGAGAAGISMALNLIGTQHKVILLEGGGFEYDDQVQELYKGNTTGQKYFPLKSSRLHYFGGTTGHWAGMCSPFDEIDFEKRDWIPGSGWPINKKNLEPYYEKANKILGLGPYEFSLEYWQKELPEMNPFPLDYSVMRNKMWQYSTARFGNQYKNNILSASNIHLYTYANVTNIQCIENVSSVKHLTVKNHAGKTHTVKAKQYVLACGAIQNARLLLASNNQVANGLGNEHDLVGRNFMEHLEVASAELWLFKEFPTLLYTWDLGVTKASAEIGITPEIQKKERILNGTASLVPLSVGRLQKPRMETFQDEDPRIAKKRMNENFGQAAEKGSVASGKITRAFQMNTRIEQAPNPNSRITLSHEKDSLGVPRADLHWELTPLDKRSIRRMYEMMGREFGKAGLGRIKLMEFLWDENDSTFPDSTNGGWHHMGTTRMSDDPKTGVVDRNCKVHGIDNLHIASTSCYVTSAAPNPTLTLVALSLRLAEHLSDLKP